MARLAIALEVLGLAVIVGGAYLIWPPAAVIVGGMGIIAIAQGVSE